MITAAALDRDAGVARAIARVEGFNPASNGAYIRYHRQRCIDDVAQLASAFPGARILNVGGRPYLFEAIAQVAGLTVDTLDIAPDRDAATIADLGLSVRCVDIEHAAQRQVLDLSPYDVVCMAEIFEHLRIDLVGTFRDLAGAMRPDAVLYLTTPNFYYAPNFLKMLATGRSGPHLVSEWNKLAGVGHMGHVREYAAGELAEFFRFTGFAVDRLIRRTTNPQALLGGGIKQVPGRLLARGMTGLSDRFAQELVFILRPAR
ncbi:class I SAM-dependent methyltransferase [Alteraurantiacibacter buctensis]|uniref:Methyltransferase domain-containing protein n=1 Tax=Alteraurantiacibacter buctensis TaxID=1503981 RepID=A0A844YV75_9SPHN|nr:methyltransferase domain-containing protein [Alteraurantiacibacter buctensis]MXO70384.1 methyltransferase domain-containing protein [Alteraurantiacibacter buctensis]